jgi:hypothetical protein
MRISKLISLVLAISCSAAFAAEPECKAKLSVKYEPTQIKLSGIVHIAHSKHPNGTKLNYPVLFLKNPIMVSGEVGAINPINKTEQCVSQIQLYSPINKLKTQLLAAESNMVSVTGTLFHSHTAWHMRKIVMSVKEIKVKSAL